MSLALEVCAFSFQSCVIAQKAGAVRVELCDNPLEGGTTPAYGVLKRTREKVSIQLYPIVRPRAGNFLYDEDEWAMIKQDILICKQLGCDGISIGVSKQNGEIDVDKMKQIVDLAYPMGVTCHRVFDATPDPFKALEDIIESGCERILTSGQKASAPEGAGLLAELVQKADGRIIIMPGAGIRSSNIAELAKTTGAKEFHTSARIAAVETLTFQNPLVSDRGHLYLANEVELDKIISLLGSKS